MAQSSAATKQRDFSTVATASMAFDDVLGHQHEREHELDEMDHVNEEDNEVRLDQVSLEAHQQVLEMTHTIDVLTQEFEKQQRELALAYKKIQELSLRDPKESSGSFGRRNSGEFQCCGHAHELQETKRLVALKDTALREACDERNALKLQLGKAQDELQSCSPADAAPRDGWTNISSFPTSSSGLRVGSSSPPNICHKVLANSGSKSSRNHKFRVPHRDRFDEESSYQRTPSAGDFWKQQYKDAVRLRKQHGLGQNAPPVAGTQRGNARASPCMRIFSYPDNTRQKGITDEQVPFTRYIGISARQNAIIKEHHRLLR